MPINLTANLLEYYNQQGSSLDDGAGNAFSTTPLQSSAGSSTLGQANTIFSTTPLGATNAATVNNPFSTTPLDGSNAATINNPFSTTPLDGSNSPTINNPFSTAALPAGLNINAILNPFSTTAISNVTSLTNPPNIPAFTPPVFATGVPGTLTFNNAYTDPNIPPTVTMNNPTGYFNPNGSLLSLGEGIPQPPNVMSPLSSLGTSGETWKSISAAGTPSYREAKTLSLLGPNKTLNETNFLDINSEYATGFTKNFTPGIPSKYTGIQGSPGALTYDRKAGVIEGLYSNTFNSTNRYEGSEKLFSKFQALDTEVQVNQFVGTKTLQQLYTQTNFDKIQIKFDGIAGSGPLVKRGIQNSLDLNFKSTSAKSGLEPTTLKDAAAEHKIRLEAAIENSGFLDRRKGNTILQLQSRFQLGLGIIPQLLATGNYEIGAGFKIREEGLLDKFQKQAFILGGTLAKIPHHIINYSVLESLTMKHGFNKDDQGFYKKGKLASLLGLKEPNNDLIPFYFEVMHKNFPHFDGKEFSNLITDGNGILTFRGTLKTIGHSITPQWSSKKYFGRPDSVHTYSGFSQNLSFSFQVYAPSVKDMPDMYHRLNELINLTKPGWNEEKSFMKGPITKLTIGDYMNSQPGFIASLSISPDEQVYWDMGKDPMRGLPQVAQIVPQGLVDNLLPPIIGGNRKTDRPKVPRAFNVSITYTIIEKEMPNADGQGFWKVANLEGPNGVKLPAGGKKGRATDLKAPTSTDGINDSGRRFIIGGTI
tara:strand:- start:808 stop:3087 length:2280 start_codon:yes stop_codon:yes gene_type:complete